MSSVYTACKRPLMLLVLLALALRVGYALSRPDDLRWGDSRDYHQVAINILAGNGPQLADNAVAFRPPGSKFLLAGIYKVCGEGNLIAVRLVQAVLSALAVWQVFVIATRLFNQQAGLLAALLVVFDPFQVHFSAEILNETLFITLLLGMSYCVLRLAEDWRWLIAAGVCAGLGTQVKPSLAYFAVFLLPFLALRGVAGRRAGAPPTFSPGSWGRVAVITVGILAVQSVVLSPWLIRNKMRLGTFTLTTMAGASLYEALGEGATGGPAMGIVKWPDVPSGLNEAQRSDFLKAAAWKHACENPAWALRLSVRKFCRFWNPILNFQELRTWKYSLISAGWYMPVMVLFFLGAWRHRQDWRGWLWLLAPVFYFTILHSIFVGSVRYRMPVMPLLCCVAGAAFVQRRDGETARLSPQSSVLSPCRTLSIIVPFLNEAKTLPKVVEELRKLPLQTEIILVNDGSTDGSRELAHKLAAEHSNIHALHHERNQGKGMAIRTGLQAATGDVVVIQDADLEYNPEDLVALWEPIEKGEAQVMYGSRTLGSRQHSYASFYWGGQLVGWVGNLLYDSNLTDEPTCYKLIRADILRDMKLDCTGFEFCPEVTAKILRQGIAIRELPIEYRPRSFAEGKKIKWVDGVIAIWTLVRYRFAD